ncbi:MAG: DNA translocase FtsK, partial [Clostridia bacterium]|nr:DNA translocase FtsK [Clostridia bacterium]
LVPVVTEAKKAAGALQWAVTEMMQRYKLFAEKNVRNFQGYNEKITGDEKPLPQIVIVIDELADLMMVAPGEVEDAICRLAQMARAAGMHLVIATQRPSADVLTGLIKANVPSRIAFAVSSGIDSRIILDQTGAEKLIGRGDMLYNPLGSPKPMRIQGCFVSDKEIEDVVGFIKKHSSGENNNEEQSRILDAIEKNSRESIKGNKKGITGSMGGTDADGDYVDDGDDVLLPRAVELVLKAGMASTSGLQRSLGVGHSRAGRLMDQMEKKGYIGPYQGSKPRDVLITADQWNEIRATQGDITQE